MHTHICTHTYAHTHAHTHTYKHTQMRTHTHTPHTPHSRTHTTHSRTHTTWYSEQYHALDLSLQVPKSQVLYAMNGQFVALGRVDPAEV